jgi:6-phosphogluconolactonase
MAKAALFDHAPLGAAQIHRMHGEERPIQSAAANYEAELDGHAMDLILLGVGNDGHTASLFPGNDALREALHPVVAVLAPPGNSVRERLTLTLPYIAQAREVWFLVTGAEKAHVVERVHKEGQASALPAAMVRAPRVVWFLDRSAATHVA